MRVLRFTAPFGDYSNYFEILKEEWERGESFINIEHDIVSRETSIEYIERCPADWCAAPYPYLNREHQFGLGLVKFSAPLIARHAMMFDVIGTWYNDDHPPKHWCTLDAWIYQFLRAFGEKRCEDHTPVGHLGHPGKLQSAHGCFSVLIP